MQQPVERFETWQDGATEFAALLRRTADRIDVETAAGHVGCVKTASQATRDAGAALALWLSGVEGQIAEQRKMN